MNTRGLIEWFRTHEPECNKNYEGSSGGMEMRDEDDIRTRHLDRPQCDRCLEGVDNWRFCQEQGPHRVNVAEHVKDVCTRVLHVDLLVTTAW